MIALRPAGPAATHCPYCALQCGMHLARCATLSDRRQCAFSRQQGRAVRQRLVSRRHACASRSAAHPLIRDGRERWPPATWDGALDRVARASARPGRHGARRGRRLRQRRADQREGLPARQVRARRAAAPPTSTTTAASACRPAPPRRPAPSASIAACPSRSRTSRAPASSCSSAATSPRRCRR